MPRNGQSAKTAKTPELDDPYDHLTQKEKDAHDEIGKLGYKPEQGSTGLWSARHRVGINITIGPSQTLVTLLGRVKDEIADDIAPGPDDEEAAAEFNNDVDGSAGEESPAGDGYLFPGMKPTQQKSCPQLVTAILNYESYKRERVDALAKEVEAKETVVGLMRANKNKLAFDPKTGIKSYRVNDYIEELVPGEEKLKTRRASDEDDD